MNPAAPGQSEMDPPVDVAAPVDGPSRRWVRSRRHDSDGSEPRATSDPRTWVMLGSGILAVVLLLFGSTRLPALAKSLGQAKREFEGSHSEHAEHDAV